jgi:hypothetical protein
MIDQLLDKYGRPLILLAGLAFLILRYSVTLGTEFKEDHDKRHLDLLGLKIGIYVVVSFGLMLYYARRDKVVLNDLLMFLFLSFLILSILLLAYTDIYKTVGIEESSIPERDKSGTHKAVDGFYYSGMKYHHTLSAAAY